jgi:hypothetical protein
MESSSVRDVLGVEWVVSHSGTESETDGAPRVLTVSASRDGFMFSVEVYELPKNDRGGVWMVDFVTHRETWLEASKTCAVEVRGCSLRSLLVRVSELCVVSRGASRVGSNVHQLRSVLRIAFARASDSIYAVKVNSLRNAVRAFECLPETVAATAAAYRLNAVTVREICHQELETECKCAGFCHCEFQQLAPGARTVRPEHIAAPDWDTFGIFPAVFAGVKSPAALVDSVLDSWWQDWSWWRGMTWDKCGDDLDAVVLTVAGDDPNLTEEDDYDPNRAYVEKALTGWDILRALALWWRTRESMMDAETVAQFRRSHLHKWSDGDGDLDIDACDGDAIVQIALYGEIVYA